MIPSDIQLFDIFSQQISQIIQVPISCFCVVFFVLIVIQNIASLLIHVLNNA